MTKRPFTQTGTYSGAATSSQVAKSHQAAQGSHADLARSQASAAQRSVQASSGKIPTGRPRSLARQLKGYQPPSLRQSLQKTTIKTTLIKGAVLPVSLLTTFGLNCLSHALAAYEFGGLDILPPPRPLSTFSPDDVTILDEAVWVEAVSRRRQNIALAPAAVTVIDGDELWNTPAWTVPDRLRYESGIDVAQWRHGLFDVGLRGTSSLNAPRTVALIDGQSFRLEHLGVLLWNSAVPAQ